MKEELWLGPGPDIAMGKDCQWSDCDNVGVLYPVFLFYCEGSREPIEIHRAGMMFCLAHIEEQAEALLAQEDFQKAIFFHALSRLKPEEFEKVALPPIDWKRTEVHYQPAGKIRRVWTQQKM